MNRSFTITLKSGHIVSYNHNVSFYCIHAKVISQASKTRSRSRHFKNIQIINSMNLKSGEKSIDVDQVSDFDVNEPITESKDKLWYSDICCSVWWC